MLHINIILRALGLSLALFLPIYAGAATGIIPCDTNCDYNSLIILVQNIIDFLIFKIAAPLGTIMFAYAGFLYVTNGGNESRVQEAHEIFINVFLGLVVCLVAWLLVNFIVTFLLGTGSTFNFLK